MGINQGMASVDWIIVAVYIVLALGVGFYFRKRASRNIKEYFISGRSLPWWLVGTSMVATTFAADTPLSVTGFVRDFGIWKNWFWWIIGISHILSVFLFSRLWRRAKVITDNELLEIRYHGKPAAFLRFFKAGYYSTFGNFIAMGWVIVAMSGIITVILDIPQQITLPAVGITINSAVLSIAICSIIALTYSLLSGLWGVVVTDFIQFILAMTGAFLLAYFSLNSAGGAENIVNTIEESANFAQSKGTLLSLFPDCPESSSFFTIFNSPFGAVITMMIMLWWSWSGADGGGYIIQRMSSSKNEKHALAATFWFTTAHYAIRTWPWIIVALASIALFPNMTEIFPDISAAKASERAYPYMMHMVLPAGAKGILVASILAAFMSTIDTHLNWGASYITNDIYKRFIKKDASESHYVNFSKIVIVLLLIFASLTAYILPSIGWAWIFATILGSGIGLVLILRWFWWRINAWSEIAALGSSIVLTLLVYFTGINKLLLGLFMGKSFAVTLGIQHKLIVIVPISIITWVTITFLTKPTPRDKLIKFYERTQPGGFWGPVKGLARNDEKLKPIFNLTSLFQWILGIIFLYGLTFGLGAMVLTDYFQGTIMLISSAVSLIILLIITSRAMRNV